MWLTQKIDFFYFLWLPKTWRPISEKLYTLSLSKLFFQTLAYSDTLLTFMEVVVILDTLVLERVDVMQQFFIMAIKIHLIRKSYMTVIYVASIWALNTIAIVCYIVLNFDNIYSFLASDITCSFPCNGKFSEKQKIIYNLVYEANQTVFKAAKPG